MSELPKAYEPKKYEDDIYKIWEESGFFHPDTCVEKGVTTDDAKHFSIVLPPPNVTGTLHMGHAAMLAIQDVIVRYHRMNGYKTLWIPGTDHAAIATQTKVEKLLMKNEGMKDPRRELGREGFLQRVDEFAEESHDIIINQAKKMGASLDWKMEAFTLDEQRSLAVRTVFKKMYEDGLVYQGYRLVNWCPRCHSTLADDEVEHKENKAKIYTFKYSSDFPFSIATTRPETKLGDSAVAVNPKDKRYKKYIGKTILVKNFAGGVDLKLKIIADENVEMKFGTGALGVTPAHSQTDYEMAEKNNLEIIKIIDENGKMTKKAGDKYLGLNVLEARAKVVESLKKEGLLEKEEEIPNNLSVCYRCASSIEPLPSKQWFIDVNKEFAFKQSKHNPISDLKDGQKITLKKLMQHVVQKEDIKIIPNRFDKTYFHWIDNLRDWCISRQIWYGHRIPVWYKDDEVLVDIEPPLDSGWKQDEDTLDTWFSSGLWTFSTLDWPEESNYLRFYHPTNVMETGYDILFFWVARMILMTTYTLGEVPFKTVYLHGLVRDEEGRKMSKSLGNVINPLDMIDKFGTDATRLSLLLGNTAGNDMKLSEDKIAGFRNFTNKLWNISRFILLNIEKPKINIQKPETKTLSDKWILEELEIIKYKVETSLENFAISFAGEELREYTWNTLADWYLEIAKIEGGKSDVLNYILNSILKLWHPFMPFVTEQIWQETYGKESILMVERWEKGKEQLENTDISIKFLEIKRVIEGIRAIRSDYKVEPAKKMKVIFSAGDKKELLKENIEILKGMARLEQLDIFIEMKRPDGYVGFVESGISVYVDLAGSVDLNKEKNRIKKEIENKNNFILNLNKKLSNKEFIRNAPVKVISGEKEKLKQANDSLEKLNKQLSDIS